MRIAMPRGDIRLIRFLIDDPNGTAPEVDFDEIYFTVKKSARDRLIEFQKKLSDGGITKINLGDYQIKINPNDTAKMAYGDYKFDVQISWTDNNGELQLKETFVGDFVLTEEVTFAENE